MIENTQKNILFRGIYMQIEQLKYIVTISTNNSISDSAADLHISQSALSQSVAKLEEELEIRIFNRSRLGTIPTVEGKQIIILANEALDKIKDIKTKADKYKISNNQQLQIGLVSGLYLPFLPLIISQLRNDFPKLNINLIEKGSVEIIQAIIDKEVDIGVLAIYENTLKKKENIHLEILYEEEMYVFVSSRSSLAVFNSLHPSQLLNEPFVLYNGEFMNWYFGKFTKQYGEVEVLFTTNNAETIRESVKKGIAITIETRLELINNPFIKSKEVIPIPLKENNMDKNHIGIATLKENFVSKENNRFINLLKSKVKELIKS